MNVPWSPEASLPREQDTSPSAGNMLSHRAATRSPVPVTAHRRAPAAHAPHAPLQHGRREAAELGEALTGSRLGKMLTQDLHVLSPLSPAPPMAAVNPGVHPSGHSLPTGLPLSGFLHTSSDGCRIKTIKKPGRGNKLENANPPFSSKFPFEILFLKISPKEIIGDLRDGRIGVWML